MTHFVGDDDDISLLLRKDICFDSNPFPTFSNRSVNSLEYVDEILKESFATSSDIRDILEEKEQEVSALAVVDADDISKLLTELYDEVDTTEGLSVSRDIFDPIPLEEVQTDPIFFAGNEIMPQKIPEDDFTVEIFPEQNYRYNVEHTIVSSIRDEFMVNSSAGDNCEDHSDAEATEDRSYCPCPKFRGYQLDQWSVRYEELCKFYETHGHSSVPHTDKSNKCLARWVKRQRYQFKLREEGKPSAMTDERIRALERLDFVWDSHGAAWEERIKELEEFKAKHKHCNVPSSYRANRSLASWIKCQRRQYRLFKEGKKSNITHSRILQLERMGLRFNIRA
mmetsp:Transcript_19909/g.32110  ORF Transcript_19909/g.32110 Transcript_19909/m.32110 type:complete len:338 (-) Transcript_19909:317-1330(-)|eukprot:CAMPEP_0178746514 /NCGR_PEP_ID=MMETSP0744-20121128/7848_1 /TAXON_ID=913974 /ORGANISM="Nitzschia punctata, Strain CCMP561" /LENGTH=337 /DNA_ID=CAMNT_0020399727 /DNA_START=110 /DNA_END=1123 /DNA_ORIENTATION=-